MNYTTLTHECQIMERLHSIISSANTYWFDTYGFTVTQVPKAIIKLDYTLYKLQQEFNADPVILKMSPMLFYKFHIDAFRPCAVNMLLQGFDSSLFYGTPGYHDELMNIEELVYEEKKLYLLNTQRHHAVLNKSQPRYLFSMGINLPHSYLQVKQYINDNKL